jgi:DNA mismatch repair protein MutS2
MSLIESIPLPVENADTGSLEWEPLLAFVAGYASSAVGRQAILSLWPSTDQGWMIRQHQLWSEVRLTLQEQVSIPLGGLLDPTQLAAKAQIPGAALEAAELQAVARLAHDVGAWQEFLREPPARLADLR